MNDVIVIGAGVAGLTAAQKLKEAGRDVFVLEKSRGLGGRSATRRVNGNCVDHGAQYFTARDKRFQSQVDEWLRQGHVKEWSHGFHRLTSKGLEAPLKGNPRYVFPEGMNTIGKLLGEGVDIRTQTTVVGVERKESHWAVRCETGEVLEGAVVILNMPPQQALTLCQFDLSSVKAQLEHVVMEPCFALMLGYDKALAPDWQGVLVENSEAISWISHDSSKRVSRGETVIVVHSTPQFARKHFDDAPETVKAHLFSALTAFHLSPLWSELQRWKYALARTYLNVKFLQCDSLYFCGDWCGGARLEAAFLSGLALAEELRDCLKSQQLQETCRVR